MGGGLMQLVAYGSQDIYLTGNPQITFFKIVYRRHTNFSMECIQQTINGISTLSDTYNTSATVTISRNGDLLSQIYVRCDQNTSDGINGDYLIEEVEIEIGGQRIDKHYREWNQIWTELTTPESKVDGFKYLTGGFSNTLVTGGLDAVGGTSQQSIMYPLQFWFCRNIGLALPLIALQYHEVKLQFMWGSGASGSGISRSTANAVTPEVEVWCDYIYLDTDERRRFAQVSHEYLIEQLQIQEEGSSRSTIKLNFDHAVKELIWTVPTSTTEANTVISQQIKLELNGHDRFAFQDREYFQLKQPLIHHSAIPGYNIKETENPKFLVNPIKLHTTAAKAAGSVADTSNPLAIDIDGATANKHISLFSTTVKPKVGDIITIAHTTNDGSNVINSASYTSCIKAVSLTATNTYAITLIENIEAPGYDTASADEVTFTIIARTQNPQSRCSQLSRDIFVFSFALNPEDHQPSGTCNFSRIESSKLLLSSAGIISNIYAVNYNVLRIMSGMGGLAYAI